jgi:enterochelin esterase-like enzyme
VSVPRVASRRVHAPLEFTGRVELVTFESELLAGNPLGDPHVRELPVYVPPGEGPFPVLFILAGYTGRGQNYLETHPWRRGIVWHHDKAIVAGEAKPAILVLPDCFTRLGGSQYVNSSAVGPYADHVIDELLPLVDSLYPVHPGARAVLGKSSGGFGALHLAMQRPGYFRACASISGHRSDGAKAFGATTRIPRRRGLRESDSSVAARSL